MATKKSVFFSTQWLDSVGSSSGSTPNEELVLGYKWDDYQKLLYGDYGITVIPSIDILPENDFTSMLSKIQVGKIEQGKPDDFLIVESVNVQKTGSPDSTNTIDINAVNRAYRNQLSEETETFVEELIRMDFEDGMENYLTEEVKGYIQDNALATYSWLNHIYFSNQKNEDVIAGLLRVIAMDVEEEDYDDLLPIVKAGLCDLGARAQEAAIMVIEKWRTKNCLDALQTANIQSLWIRSYAKKVELELIKELSHAN